MARAAGRRRVMVGSSGRRKRMRADDGDPGTVCGPGVIGDTHALDALLRAERSAIAVTVALGCGATTYADRAHLARIGGELVILCCALRERLDLAGSAVPEGTDYEARAMLATESYDARLAALADFLDATAGQATAALAAAEDRAYVRTLRDLIPTHAHAAQWLRERAAAFAASRPHDEPRYDPTYDPGAGDASGADADAEPAPSGDTTTTTTKGEQDAAGNDS